MKSVTSLLCCCALGAVAFAGEPATPVNSETGALHADSFKRLSGSLTLGFDTNGHGRGIVLSHSAVGGDGSPFGALKLNYDFGEKGGWSYDTTLAYRDSVSGHTLYGNPTYSSQFAAAYVNAMHPGLAAANPTAFQAAVNKMSQMHIKQANCEPEFAVVNNFSYKKEKWNVTLGHDFIHGGIIGVMTKHFRHQGASCVNEVFVRPELTPYKWFSAGLTVRYSISGIDGWWFEPDMTFKAPLIGTEDDVKVAGVVKLAMSATGNYFNHTDSACGNGSQAFYVRFMTPWYVTDQFILTPGVSLHWLGRGAVKCNEKSAYKTPTSNPTYVPFRNFAVVGTIMATYTF